MCYFSFCTFKCESHLLDIFNDIFLWFPFVLRVMIRWTKDMAATWWAWILYSVRNVLDIGVIHRRKYLATISSRWHVYVTSRLLPLASRQDRSFIVKLLAKSKLKSLPYNRTDHLPTTYPPTHNFKSSLYKSIQVLHYWNGVRNGLFS